MVPVKPPKTAPLSSAVGPKPAAAPRMLAGPNTRSSTRIRDKKSAFEKEREKKLRREQGQGMQELDPEPEVRLQWANPELEYVEQGSAQKSEATTAKAQNTAGENGSVEGEEDEEHGVGQDEDTGAELFHTTYRAGPKLKTIGELLAEIDTKGILNIPANKVITSEHDAKIREEMIAVLPPDCDLTPQRTRILIAEGVEACEFLWHIRTFSRIEYWDRVSRTGGWLRHLGGPICREFFLRLLVMYKNGSGEEATNRMTQAIERLYKLFQRENKNELEDFIGAGVRLPSTANMFLGRGRLGGDQAVRGSSNIHFDNRDLFDGTASTNMTTEHPQLAEITARFAPVPITSFGDARKERMDQERRLAAVLEEGRKEGRGQKKIVPASKRNPGNRTTTYELANLFSKTDIASGRVQPVRATKGLLGKEKDGELAKQMRGTKLSTKNVFSGRR
ncbi:hypothetical protein VMCG_08562 [Cytospora schulzeri]|uniref:Uncharacterized protein n=1 Tax=Cytospora schulzeri TaxID=448051 RepID=A0A423VVR3_9PEZI|nr:hypothetical protein VMCG_08562 [Valsa malicola]